MGLVGPFQGPINSICRMVRGRYPRLSYSRPFQGACPCNGNLPASTNEAPDVAWILTPLDRPGWSECSDRMLYSIPCSPAVSSCCISAFCQLESGLYFFIALARTSVLLPRSF